MLKKTKKENVSLKLYFMVQTNEFRAISKYVRMSPSKIRRVLRQLEGKTYAEALLVLQFMPYTSCRPIIKVLRSATANAKNNFGLDETQLIVCVELVECHKIFHNSRNDFSKTSDFSWQL